MSAGTNQPSDSEKTRGASPIFMKSFDMVLWVLEHTKKYPKHQRFVLAKRTEEAALSCHDQLVWATKTRRPAEALAQADFHLERLRMYNRLALKMRLESLGQYEHWARMLEELGRLLAALGDELDPGFVGHGLTSVEDHRDERPHPAPYMSPARIPTQPLHSSSSRIILPGS